MDRKDIYSKKKRPTPFADVQQQKACSETQKKMMLWFFKYKLSSGEFSGTCNAICTREVYTVENGSCIERLNFVKL